LPLCLAQAYAGPYMNVKNTSHSGAMPAFFASLEKNKRRQFYHFI